METRAQIIYDTAGGAVERINMVRPLDEPARPGGLKLRVYDEYSDLIDNESGVFFASGELPSAKRFGELVPRLIGREVWNTYRELSPDFTALVNPLYDEAEDLLDGYKCVSKT
jgi:hypothetical protein